jgi:protocatechuate 3,4-dioxygenase alpha subunit
MTLPTTSSQTVGPFFAAPLSPAEWGVLAGPDSRGDKIIVEGHVLDGDGVPAHDLLVEIWQANAEGRYDHPDDTQDKPLDPTFHGWGRCRTDANGAFRFTTIMPGPVPGRGNTMQAPHINFTLFARGLLRQLTTRLYFAGNPLNEADPVLALVPDEALKRTLLARPVDGGTPRVWRFDIVLQGDGETVFFEV